MNEVCSCFPTEGLRGPLSSPRHWPTIEREGGTAANAVTSLIPLTTVYHNKTFFDSLSRSIDFSPPPSPAFVRTPLAIRPQSRPRGFGGDGGGSDRGNPVRYLGKIMEPFKVNLRLVNLSISLCLFFFASLGRAPASAGSRDGGGPNQVPAGHRVRPARPQPKVHNAFFSSL